LSLMPNPPDWMDYGLATYHYVKGEYQEALDIMSGNLMRDFYWTHAHLAANYAQLGRLEDAHRAVADLLRIYPDFGSNYYDEAAKWNMPDSTVARFADDLRKAGLDVPDPPAVSH